MKLRRISYKLQLKSSHCLISNKLKHISLGQCVTQAARNKSILCPIPFGLRVQLDNTFGSKWLVNHLSKLGLLITLDEVLRFKQSAVAHSSQLTNAEEVITEDTNFAQWAVDNVDHNIITLTGKGTFHGMGIICISETTRQISSLPIKRPWQLWQLWQKT